jgi:hypothetical protein
MLKPLYKRMSSILLCLSYRTARRGWVAPARGLANMAARLQSKAWGC